MIKFLLVSQKILEDDVTSPFIIYIQNKKANINLLKNYNLLSKH